MFSPLLIHHQAGQRPFTPRNASIPSHMTAGMLLWTASSPVPTLPTSAPPTLKSSYHSRFGRQFHNLNREGLVWVGPGFLGV